jgi:hypothetical protein
MSFNTVWMNAKTAADYLDYSDCREPAEAFRVWAKRHGVPTARRGSRVLYDRKDIDRAIGAAHLVQRKTA